MLKNRIQMKRKHSPEPEMSLPIEPSCYEGRPFPSFARPTEVGTFSLDAERKVHADRHQMKFFRERPGAAVDFDLNTGYSSWIQVDSNDKHYINDILEWLRIEKERNGFPDYKTAAKNADFLCYRGFLTKIASLPYERRDELKMAAIVKDGIIFLCEYETEQKRKSVQERTERESQMTYWGYKFETFVVTDTPESVPDTQSPVDNNQAFCSVVRGKLGENRLLFPGEVDCLDSETKKYVELKTNREFTNRRQEDNFYRFKTCKWWLQSFLIGIEDIVVGFRDDNGRVRRMERMPIASFGKDSRATWRPSVCLNFLEVVLNLLRKTVTNEGLVYLLEWKPGMRAITLRALLREEAEEYQFLPEWFK